MRRRNAALITTALATAAVLCAFFVARPSPIERAFAAAERRDVPALNEVGDRFRIASLEGERPGPPKPLDVVSRHVRIRQRAAMVSNAAVVYYRERWGPTPKGGSMPGGMCVYDTEEDDCRRLSSGHLQGLWAGVSPAAPTVPRPLK